ncbi:MAG: hypothetical protein QM718_15315 [Steroidobacteraceae bacterium]
MKLHRISMGGSLLLALALPLAWQAQAADAPATEPAASVSAQSAAQPAAADAARKAAAAKAAGGAKAADAKPAAAKPADVKPSSATDKIQLDTTQITGNKELPKVMYVVPWKKSDLGEFGGRPARSLLDEVLAPVDRDVFRRQTSYYNALQPDAAAATAGGDEK